MLKFFLFCICGMLAIACVARHSLGLADEAVNITAQEANDDAPVIDVTGDSGLEAVLQAAGGPGAKFVANESATETLQAFAAAKDWQIGWDDKKKRYFDISTQKMNLEEPATDIKFYDKREMLAKRAMLRSKANIISYISAKMSASDRLTIPGTDMNTKFGAANDAAEAKLRSQKKQLARLLREYDEAEADALEGATVRDRAYALIDAAIRKLDQQYSAETIEQKKADKYAKAKQKYEEAKKELEDIQSQVDKAVGQIQDTQISEIESLAAMPLIGATVIEQTESWNAENETYEVSLLVCWSAKLEQSARAALTGEVAVSDEPASNETRSVQQWLNSQELGRMVGPRQFLDSVGQRWLLGITARPVSKNASTDERNIEQAKIFATQIAAFSLFADVETQTRAKQMMTTLNTSNLNRSETQVTDSLEQQLSQSFQSLKIQGMGMLANKIVEHPLTGQKIHVVAYGISPAAAKAAMEVEQQTNLAAIQVHKNQAFQNGRSQALRDSVDAAKNDAASAQAGRNEVKMKTTAAGKPPAAGKESAESKDNKPKETKSGSTKVGNVKDDF